MKIARLFLAWMLIILPAVAAAREQILTVTSENDAYTRTGDGNYTNGLRLSWLDADNQPPVWLRKIDEFIPGFALARTTIPIYSLGQSIYTPANIVPFTNQPQDRPYAGYTYGSVGVSAGDLNQVDDLELTLGWVGPGAGGEQVQSRYHELIGVQKPNGWEHQLHDEPALGASWQRRWPRRLGVNVGEGLISTMPYLGATVGNVRTHATAGAILSWRSQADILTDMPLRVAPGVPGSGYFTSTEHINWLLFAGVEGRAVARDIFLDGNTFRDSPNVRKRNGVADLSAGVMLTYKRYQIGYTTVYRSPEFYGQPEGQIFGALSLGMKF
jgi:lipid A 3-O-deacylase